MGKGVRNWRPKLQDRDQRKTRVNDLTAAPVEKDGKCSRNRIQCVITKATSIYPFTVVRNLPKFLLLDLNLFQPRFVSFILSAEPGLQ